MKVTIITVCYNACEELRMTLESVCEQTFKGIEYIVVDGGSTDGTLSLLEEFRNKFSNNGISFRYISEHDEGTYDAMNKGALMAEGEWINYMNAGDRFFSTNSIAQFFSHNINADSGILYGDTLQVFDFGSGIAKATDYAKDNPIMPFCHQSCFVKADLVKKYRFDTSYKIIADHDFFFRLYEDGIKSQYIEEVVAQYNGQYGLSATHPLTLRLEGLRIHHVTERWYYPLAVCWCYLRYGWIQPFKNHMPRWMTNVWMKHKRKFIK